MEISENRSKQVILLTNGEISVRLRGFFHSQRFWCKVLMHILATKSLGSFEKHPIIEIRKVTTIHWSHPVTKNHLLACKLTQQLYHIVYIIVVIPGLVNCYSLRTGKIHHAMKMAKSTTFRLGHFQVRKLIWITPFQRILVSIPRTRFSFPTVSIGVHYPIGSMYGIYANIWGILMVNVTIYSIHGSYGYGTAERNPVPGTCFWSKSSPEWIR